MLNITRRQAQAHRNALLAFGNGEPIQYRFKESDPWIDMQHLGEGDDELCLRFDIFYRVKPKPKYRPFNSAEEFEPHRDRWVIGKDKASTVCATVHHYSDSHVSFALGTEIRNIEWKYAFDVLRFDDGTLFGVPCDADD